MNKLQALLNKEVANLAVFFTKLHHFHWYVTGKEFFTLHQKFEELYDEVNELYDAFAERLIMIGGKPASSMKAYLELSIIRESDEMDPNKMVLEVVEDLKIMALEIKELTRLAQDEGDEQTADLAISTVSSFDKHNWMFQVYLK